MNGINYLINRKGKRTAVVFDLKRYKLELEDFIDGLEAASRAKEPSVDFEKAASRIIKQKAHRAISRQNKKIS